MKARAFDVLFTKDKPIISKAFLHERRQAHKRYVREHGEDMPEIRNWQWGSG